uniref:DNA topoisomerase IV subunit A n=1 Tax=Pararhizobium sp. IMCC3301 TaxID=3067904 RepID=UPI0027404E86|nr:DNA topoisomerase IV subunit A [Pararhizobium sp. IMCC3301]
MGEKLIPEGEIELINLRSALEERYLAYALSTITHRALPDVRDGLKPVHRRLLYAMRQLKLDPNSSFKKSARVVGDVIGKYHPHGDQSVYDALVRLAQDFAVRYPLVDGQGNFGNVDGDNAAAMRYTEARMTEVANRLLEGLDEDAVDFRETYDGEEQEPIVLPANFPNLLANGSTGIAVGMATSIPPHNIVELCDASLHLVKYPNAGIEKLCEFVKGPDFPTGGVIVENEASIRTAYETGRGGFRVRARWHAETLSRGAYVVVVTEIPYQVQKSKLIEKIAELLQAKRLPLLADIRDESAEDIRVVLEPKSRTVDPALMMESLFKLTDFENRISLNMNVLSHGRVPRVLSLRGVLREWLDHRKVVLVRRANFRLRKIDHRLEILVGYLVAFLNLDEVIRIIREEDHPKADLMKTFALTDIQAEAILNMRLRSLRKLEEIELRQEHENLTAERAELAKLVASEDLQWTRITEQIRDLKKFFGPDTPLGKRRTSFAIAPEHNLDDIHQAMIEREPVTIVLSQKGWVRALRGHLADAETLTFKQDDALKLMFHAETTDKLLVASTGGKFYTLGADKLPGGRGHGEPVRIMVDMEADQDILTIFTHQPGRKRLVASTEGRGFVVSEDDLLANTRKGKQVLNMSAPHKMVLCPPAIGDWIAIVGENRKLLVFPLQQIAEMSRGKGVRLQRYKDGTVADIKVFAAEAGLTWSDSSGRQYNRSLEDLAEWVGERAQAGRMAPQGFPRSNRFGG